MMSTTDSLSVPGSTGYHTHVISIQDMPSPKTTATQTQFPRPGMPQRYESEEEEVSEADTPSQEHFFSSTDAESEASGYESDVNDETVKRWSQVTTKASDDDAFTLRLSTGSSKKSGSGDGSRPTSVYTIKPGRGSNCSGLSPMPLLRAQDEGSTSTSTHEADANMRSFYSDTLSSDEDHPPDAHFCTATPVTYFAPHTRPNLVSISPSLARASTAKVSKKTKKQHSPLSRKSSTDSNRSMKKRISQLRLSQTDNKRNSTLVFQVSDYQPSSEFSPRAGSGAGSVRSSLSTARNRDSTGSAKREKQWPLPEEPVGRRVSIQPSRNIQSSPLPPPPPPKEHHRPPFDRSRASGSKLTGYRTRTNISVPLPSTIGLATSSPSPGTFSHRTSYRPPPTPPTATSEPPSYSRFRASSSTPDAWGDPFPSPSYPSHFEHAHPHPHLSSPVTPGSEYTRPSSGHSRERTRSISSMASGSSKFSLPFDAGSVRSMMKRSRRRVESTASTTSTSTSISTSTSNVGPYRERTASHSNSSSRFAARASASKSTTNLTSYLTSTPTSSTSSHFPRVESLLGTGTQPNVHVHPNDNFNNNNNNNASATSASAFASRRPGLGLRRNSGSPTGAGQNAPLRSKSTKWLQSTGERAIGMLRKKSTSPGV